MELMEYTNPLISTALFELPVPKRSKVSLGGGGAVINKKVKSMTKAHSYSI